jgi:hypothetical protein
MLAHPCNQSMSFLCEASRQARMVQLWQQQNPGQTEGAPRLKTPLEQAVDNSMYATHYGTKPDNPDMSTTMMAMSFSLTKTLDDLTLSQRNKHAPS